MISTTLSTIVRIVAAVCAAFALGSAAAAQDEAALKQDAVSRLIESHDPALSVNIGRVYVKQAALKAARELLADRGKAAGLGQAWNLESPLWRDAERELMQGVDALIERRVANPVWVKEAWSQLVSEKFNAEQADEVAVHFQTEGCVLQRRVIEWFVG